MEIQGGPGRRRLFPSTTKHRQTLTCVWCSPPPFLGAFGKEKLHLPTLWGKKPRARSAGSPRQLLKAHVPKLRGPQEKGTGSSVMYDAEIELRNFPPSLFFLLLEGHMELRAQDITHTHTTPECPGHLGQHPLLGC